MPENPKQPHYKWLSHLLNEIRLSSELSNKKSLVLHPGQMYYVTGKLVYKYWRLKCSKEDQKQLLY